MLTICTFPCWLSSLRKSQTPDGSFPIYSCLTGTLARHTLSFVQDGPLFENGAFHGDLNLKCIWHLSFGFQHVWMTAQLVEPRLQWWPHDTRWQEKTSPGKCSGPRGWIQGSASILRWPLPGCVIHVHRGIMALNWIQDHWMRQKIWGLQDCSLLQMPREQRLSHRNTWVFKKQQHSGKPKASGEERRRWLYGHVSMKIWRHMSLWLEMLTFFYYS